MTPDASRVGPAALVVGSAPLSDAGLDQLFDLASRAALVVAADGGMRHLLALGLGADWLVGDLDSLDLDLQARVPESTRWQRHPRDKDATDLELALRLAARESEASAELWIAAALGGRVDHGVANLQLAMHAELRRRRLRFVHGDQTLWHLTAPDRLEIAGAAGDTLSLIPMSDTPTRVRSRGLRWPLDGSTLDAAGTRGLSNTLSSPTASVELIAGRLLCVHIPAASRILSV